MSAQASTFWKSGVWILLLFWPLQVLSQTQLEGLSVGPDYPWNPLSVAIENPELVYEVRQAALATDVLAGDEGEALRFIPAGDSEGLAWEKQRGNGVNFGFTENMVQLRFGIRNDTSERQSVVLHLANPVLDRVDIEYSLGGKDQKVLTGDRRPFGQRALDHPHFVLPLHLEPGQEVPILISAQTEGSLQLPVELLTANAFLEHTTAVQKLHFYYFGVLSVTILITFVLFLMLREAAYIYYALATLGYLLFFAAIRGFTFQHFFSDSPELNTRLFLFSMPMLALFSLLFAQKFLNTARNTPRLQWLIRGMIVFETINLLVALVMPYNVAIRISALLAIPLWIALVTAGPLAWRAGSRSAIYFTAAWTLLTMGIIVTSLHKAGVLPNTLLTEYSMQVGSAFEAVLLAFGLADRFYQAREDKIRMQEQLLAESRQRRDMQQKLIEYALHDMNSGLPNRSLVEMRLAELLAERNKEWFIGIFWFRRMRDITNTLGEKSAEDILRLTAAALNAEAARLPGIQTIEMLEGRNLCVGYLSSDRLVMVSQADIVRAQQESYFKLLEFLTQPREYKGFKLELQPVLGLSNTFGGGDTQTLLRRAQIAVEQASQTGRAFAFYRESVDEYDRARLTLMTDLRQALSRQGGTELHYQPKIDARSRSPVGVEALMRWNHPDIGWIPPHRFIPLAETTDLIGDLTQWVMFSALRDLKHLRDMGEALTMSINLSARNLSSAGLAERLDALRESVGMSSDCIILELTESTMMQEPEAGISCLKGFRQKGYRIAIDDFGTGYSSLSYLQRMPVEEIKIDKSLVQEICRDDSARLILKATIDMCHQLGYAVVAEGVECEEEADLLTAMGCDLLQGFHFARPMPLDALMVWLRQTRHPDSD